MGSQRLRNFLKREPIPHCWRSRILGRRKMLPPRNEWKVQRRLDQLYVGVVRGKEVMGVGHVVDGNDTELVYGIIRGPPADG